MSLTQQEQPRKTAVFDEKGQTVEEIETPQEEAQAQAPEGAIEEAATEENGEVGEVESSGAPPQSGKYRIGDRTFGTPDEALAYAQNHVSALETEQQIADAYRQGLRDAVPTLPEQHQDVTPPKSVISDLNTEELYTNPNEFLQKFANKIKTETQAELDQRSHIKNQSDQIWREFVDRHPALADFRQEVEGFVEQNQTEVRAINSTKGRKSSYDWIAMKLRARFESYANAVKPKRELPNGGSGAPPAQKAAGVTPKADAKKPLSFADQIRSIRSIGKRR